MRAEHVRADELVRAVDGAIDVAFGGEMHHRVGRVPLEDVVHRRAVADVGADEAVARAARNRLERAEIGGVGQLVDVDDRAVGLPHEIAADRRADEPRAPRDDDLQSSRSQRDSHRVARSGRHATTVLAHAEISAMPRCTQTAQPALRGLDVSGPSRTASHRSTATGQAIPRAGSSKAIPRSHSGA